MTQAALWLQVSELLCNLPSVRVDSGVFVCERERGERERECVCVCDSKVNYYLYEWGWIIIR